MLEALRDRLGALPIDLAVRRSGRSWWQVEYVGGRTWAEWDTVGDPGRINPDEPVSAARALANMQARTRWEDLRHDLICRARLWAPNGMNGELHATRPYAFFQFKVARRGQLSGDSLEAHVLGMLLGDDGAVGGFQWLPGAGRLEQFRDYVVTMHARWGVGPFDPVALGLRL